MHTDANKQFSSPPPNLVKELTAFCQRHGGDLFAGWSRADIAKWVAWHLELRGLLYLRHGDRIVALAGGRLSGKEMYFEKVIAIRPGALAALVAEFKRRFPQWREWTLFRHCHGRQYLPVSPAWLNRIEQLT